LLSAREEPTPYPPADPGADRSGQVREAIGKPTAASAEERRDRRLSRSCRRAQGPEIGVDHPVDQLVERHALPPAEPGACVAWVAHSRGRLGSAAESRIEPYVIRGFQPDLGERDLRELLDCPADTASEDVVAGPILLKHQPGPEHDVAGE